MPIKIPFPQIVNELSFIEETNHESFLDRMKTFLAVIDGMHSIGFGLLLTYVRSMENAPCYSGIPLRQWLFSGTSDVEERKLKQRLASMFSKARRLDDELVLDAGKELKYQGTTLGISGFAAAYYYSLPAISRRISSVEDNCHITIDVNELHEDGAIVSTTATIESICQLSHIQIIRGTITEQIIQNITQSRTPLKDVSQICPYLDFSEEARKQLQQLPHCLSASWVCAALFSLNQIMEKTLKDRGAFENNVMGRINCSDESPTTKQKYPGTRTFHWEDGTQRECWLHAKNVGANLRIHFLPDENNEKVYVGYIGPHLPTSRFGH